MQISDEKMEHIEVDPLPMKNVEEVTIDFFRPNQLNKMETDEERMGNLPAFAIVSNGADCRDLLMYSLFS